MNTPETFSYLSHWLIARADVQPENVSIVIQVRNGRDKAAIEAVLKRDLAQEFITAKTLSTGVAQYCGLNIEVRSLPENVRRLEAP